MHVISRSFLENMTLIITFMYLMLKFKEFLILKFKNISFWVWIAPIIVSLLSVIIMLYQPLLYKGFRLDLRGVPIFYISYLLGWKLGFLSIIFPILFRFELGGLTVFEGIIQGILIPYLVGSFFHDKKNYNPPYTIINFKRMMLSFACYQLIRWIFLLWPILKSINIMFSMIFFETVAVLCIFWMRNDINRNLFTRKELEYYSRHDNMTNLYNLRFFRKNVEKLIQNNHPFVIAMFDVDHFKIYNDTHGHPAGDDVLRAIGQLLSVNMRKDDIFARYGGEEFIICMSNISTMQVAVNIAEWFQKKVEEHAFYGEDTQPTGKLTISMGLSSISNGQSLDQLIEEADKMLYKAKRLGRNTTAFAE